MTSLLMLHRTVIGEVQSLISALRSNPRFCARARFQCEIPRHQEHPFLCSLLQLRDQISTLQGFECCSSERILSPFCTLLEAEDTSGPITAQVLAGLARLLDQPVIRFSEILPCKSLIIRALLHTKFEFTDPIFDQFVLIELARVMARVPSSKIQFPLFAQPTEQHEPSEQQTQFRHHYQHHYPGHDAADGVVDVRLGVFLTASDFINLMLAIYRIDLFNHFSTSTKSSRSSGASGGDSTAHMGEMILKKSCQEALEKSIVDLIDSYERFAATTFPHFLSTQDSRLQSSQQSSPVFSLLCKLLDVVEPIWTRNQSLIVVLRFLFEQFDPDFDGNFSTLLASVQQQISPPPPPPPRSDSENNGLDLGMDIQIDADFSSKWGFSERLFLSELLSTVVGKNPFPDLARKLTISLQAMSQSLSRQNQHDNRQEEGARLNEIMHAGQRLKEMCDWMQLSIERHILADLCFKVIFKNFFDMFWIPSISHAAAAAAVATGLSSRGSALQQQLSLKHNPKVDKISKLLLIEKLLHMLKVFVFNNFAPSGVASDSLMMGKYSRQFRIFFRHILIPVLQLSRSNSTADSEVSMLLPVQRHHQSLTSNSSASSGNGDSTPRSSSYYSSLTDLLFGGSSPPASSPLSIANSATNSIPQPNTTAHSGGGSMPGSADDEMVRQEKKEIVELFLDFTRELFCLDFATRPIPCITITQDSIPLERIWFISEIWNQFDFYDENRLSQTCIADSSVDRSQPQQIDTNQLEQWRNDNLAEELIFTVAKSCFAFSDNFNDIHKRNLELLLLFVQHFRQHYSHLTTLPPFCNRAPQKIGVDLHLFSRIRRLKIEFSHVIHEFNQEKYSVALARLKNIGIESSADVARFFVENMSRLDPARLGDFFGENDGRNLDILSYFIRSKLASLLHVSSFLHQPGRVSIDEALRYVLGSFYLPGEAQKIDRIISCFADVLYSQSLPSSTPTAAVDSELLSPASAGTTSSSASSSSSNENLENSDNTIHFENQDAVYVFSFSIVMLNTDLHSTQVKRKMTLNEWIRNNQGINNGLDFPIAELTRIYHTIKRTPFKILHEKSGSLLQHASEWHTQIAHTSVSALLADLAPTPQEENSYLRRVMIVLKPHLFFVRVVGHIVSSLHSGMDCSQDAVFINSGLKGYRDLLGILQNLAQFIAELNIGDHNDDSGTLGVSLNIICYWIDYIVTSAWCHSKQFALNLVKRLILSNVHHLATSPIFNPDQAQQTHRSDLDAVLPDSSVLRIWRLCFSDLIIPCLRTFAEANQPPPAASVSSSATEVGGDIGTARHENVFLSDPELRQHGSRLSNDFLTLFVRLFTRIFPTVSHILKSAPTAAPSSFSPWPEIHRDLVTGLTILEQLSASKTDKQFLDRNASFIAKSISDLIHRHADAVNAGDSDGLIRDKMMKILRNCVMVTNSRFEELLHQFPAFYANATTVAAGAPSPSSSTPETTHQQNQDNTLQWGLELEDEDVETQQALQQDHGDDQIANLDSDEGRLAVMRKASAIFQLTKSSLAGGVFKWPENVPAIVDTVLVLTRFVGNFSGTESGIAMVDTLLNMHAKIVTEMTALKAKSEELSVWIRAWIYVMRGLAAQVVGVGGSTTSPQQSGMSGSAGVGAGGSSREVRNAAAISLQRALLDNNLSPGAELIESCIRNVLFVLIEELTRRKLAIVSEATSNTSGMRRTSSYNSLRSRRIEDFEEMQMRASSLLVKIVLRYLGEFTSVKDGNERAGNSSFPRLWLDLLEVLKKCVITAHADLLIEAIHESLKNMLLVFHAQDVFAEWVGLWESTRIKLEQFIPDLIAEVTPLQHVSQAEQVATTHDPNDAQSQPQQPASPPQPQPQSQSVTAAPPTGTLKV